MEGRNCYLLNDNVVPDPGPAIRIPPFGYPPVGDPPSAPLPPLKMHELEQYVSPGDAFAMTDVDKMNVPNHQISWWMDLPSKPVHGQVRNELFFDWHVTARRVLW
jgi:hypothetical protein